MILRTNKNPPAPSLQPSFGVPIIDEVAVELAERNVTQGAAQNGWRKANHQLAVPSSLARAHAPMPPSAATPSVPVPATREISHLRGATDGEAEGVDACDCVGDGVGCP